MKTAPYKIAWILLLLLLVGPPATVFGQELSFSCSVDTDAGSVLPLYFGLREDALSGLDPYDVPEPPAAPGTALRAYLAMQTPPTVFPNRWHCDMRPLSGFVDKRIEIWEFGVETETLSGRGVISVAPHNVPDVPFKLWIQGPGGLYELLDPPCTVSFAVTSPVTSFFWILEIDESVAAPRATWGGVKARFR